MCLNACAGTAAWPAGRPSGRTARRPARSTARSRRWPTTTLTTFGFGELVRVGRAGGRAWSSRRPDRRTAPAPRAIIAGSISGSSPWTLTTTSQVSAAATSARRSVPLRWSARVMHGHAAVGLDRVAHPGVVGGDDDVGDARRPPRLLDDTDDHRQAAQVDEGLAGQPGRGVAGGDDGDGRRPRRRRRTGRRRGVHDAVYRTRRGSAARAPLGATRPPRRDEPAAASRAERAAAPSGRLSRLQCTARS